jgi:hypothetical protein
MCPERARARPIRPGARLLCLIALTYRIGRALIGDPETALLARRPSCSCTRTRLVLASIRSIPDVALCLFILLSAFGILSLTALGRRTPGAYWAAYLGAWLAATSNGLLALVFLLFAWVFSRVDLPARGDGTGAPLSPLSRLPLPPDGAPRPRRRTPPPTS